MPDHEKIIDAYWTNKSPAFSHQYQKFFGIPLSPVGIFLQTRYKKILKILLSLPGEKFLDVGCGPGVFMIPALAQGKYAVGIDYSKQMLLQAEKKLSQFPKTKYKLIFANATKIPLSNNSADIILASGLTDYLTTGEVAQFFDQLNRVLKKGGHAIITFPVKGGPWNFLRSGIGLKIREKILHLPPLATTYTRTEILKLFRNANLKLKAWDRVLLTMEIAVGEKI